MTYTERTPTLSACICPQREQTINDVTYPAPPYPWCPVHGEVEDE